jgi:uncharacterized protein
MLPHIKAFIQSRSGRVSARATVTRYNIELLEITKHLIGLGFRNAFLSPVSATEEKSYSLRKKDIASLIDSYDEVTDYYMENIENGNYIGIPYLRMTLGKLYSPGPPALYPCGAGRAMLAISPEGNIFPCHRFVGITEFQMGNVLTGYDDRINKEILVNHVDTRKKCRSCWARYWCGGGCYAHNYSINCDIYTPCRDWCQIIKNTIKVSVSMYLRTYARGDEALDNLYRQFFPQTSSYSLSTEESAVILEGNNRNEQNSSSKNID